MYALTRDTALAVPTLAPHGQVDALAKRHVWRTTDVSAWAVGKDRDFVANLDGLGGLCSQRQHGQRDQCDDGASHGFTSFLL